MKTLEKMKEEGRESMMKDNVIPIFLNADDNYVVPTYIALFSLLYNYRGTAKIAIYVLIAGAISQRNAVLLNSLADRFPQATIELLEMKNEYDSVSVQIEYISSACLYRLMISRIADAITDGEMDRCIYLDADLIVTGNIEELFRIDVDGYFVAGVKDLLWLSDHVTDYAAVLGIPTTEYYINSGVLLLNLKAIKQREGLRERLEKAGYVSDFLYPDQDAINSVLYEAIKILPLKFNTMARDIYRKDQKFEQTYGKKNIEEARKKPVIIHYITQRKPWSYKAAPLAGEWWKYVRMQDADTIREYVRPFLKAHRLPFKLAVKERVKEVLKRLEIFYAIRNAIN